jgi:TonB family protein
MRFLFTASSWLGISSLLLIATVSFAVAQTNPTDGKAYSYVEKMPQLPGGYGSDAILRAVQQRFVYPPAALRDKVEGRVFVKITVGANGLVQRADIVRGLRADCDSAVVKAVRQLPRFEPANRGGQQPVASTFTLPITLVAR